MTEKDLSVSLLMDAVESTENNDSTRMPSIDFDPAVHKSSGSSCSDEERKDIGALVHERLASQKINDEIKIAPSSPERAILKTKEVDVLPKEEAKGMSDRREGDNITPMHARIDGSLFCSGCRRARRLVSSNTDAVHAGVCLADGLLA